MNKQQELYSIEDMNVENICKVESLNIDNYPNNKNLYRKEEVLIKSKFYDSVIDVYTCEGELKKVVNTRSISVNQKTETRQSGSSRFDMETISLPNPFIESDIDYKIQDSIERLFNKMAEENGFPTTLKQNHKGTVSSKKLVPIVWLQGDVDYYLNGVHVPRKVIVDPKSITKDEFLEVKNAEVRRIVVERIGIDRFVELLDLMTVDEDTINGDAISLVRTRERDPVAMSHIQFVRVRDTSTDRVYHLGVPPHIEGAVEGVAWTFGMSVEEYNPEVEA